MSVDIGTFLKEIPSDVELQLHKVGRTRDRLILTLVPRMGQAPKTPGPTFLIIHNQGNFLRDY